MKTTVPNSLRSVLVILAAAPMFVACSDTPIAPNQQPAITAQRTTLPTVDTDGAIATLQRVTARYHDLQVALDDDFVLLHECENRPGEGPVGTVYVNFTRVLDGVIDPESPDALIYEPSRNGRPKLVGVEFAVLDQGQQLPTFLGATFQREPEFGVLALHAWVWRYNPEGLFAETNPNVSCGEE